MNESVFPDVAFHGGSLWVAYREDPRVPGRLVVLRDVVVRRVADRDVVDGTEHTVINLPAGSPCFPKLHAWGGILWLAYHDGTVGHLRTLDPAGPDHVLSPCENNDPICFGAWWVAWQGAQRDGWPISLMDLLTGQVVAAGNGQGTGLSRVLTDGRVRTIDADRFAGPPHTTRPHWAGDLVVAEGSDTGVVWSLADGRTGVLWPTLPSWTPAVAVDGERVAVVTWGAQTDIRVWTGTRAELPVGTIPPTPEPEPIPEPVPMPEIPDQSATVARVRTQFPTPLGRFHAACLIEIAQTIGLDAGLLRKTGGTVITLPGGVTVSQDIICFPDGRAFDCLGDAEGEARPGWSEIERVDPSRYYRVTSEPTPDPEPEPDPPGEVSTHDLVLALGRHLGAWK